MNTLPNYLVAIAKNEDYYIEEWIQYYLKLGFDYIIIYTDNWSFSYDHKQVTIIPQNLDVTNRQVYAYNQFLKDYEGKYEWVAFFDIDEFLVLNQHNNIKAFLREYNGFYAVGINWAIYGNNFLDKFDKDNPSVLKRFTRRSKKDFFINHHVKCIRHNTCPKTQDVHAPKSIWVTTQKENRKGSTNKLVNYSVAQLNHYFTKSKEEWDNKIKRGRATVDFKRKQDEYKYYANRNEILDTNARLFLYNY